ncbi:probable low-specificity L-threonine aldolase 1 [Trichonephila clavipes]|nr:probable low-specificity L-threonine aldolase 1 [Trichonephila clavipes]
MVMPYRRGLPNVLYQQDNTRPHVARHVLTIIDAQELQERIAKFLGKEAALFVPSGTMGNLTAVMAHCWTRGQEIIIGDESHMFMYEQGGISQLASVHVSSIPTLEDGTFDLEVLKEKIRPKFPNIHEPSTGLICIENSHNRCGGRVLPMSFIRERYLYAKI